MLEPLAIKPLPEAGVYCAVMSPWTPGASVLIMMLAVPTFVEPTWETVCVAPIWVAPS